MTGKIILGLLIGGAAGALMGYFGKCSSGTCPLTSTPWRGMLYGMALGLLFAMSMPVKSGGTSPATSTPPPAAQPQPSTQNTQGHAPSPDDLAKHIQNTQKIVLVGFYSDNCPSCRQLETVLAKLGKMYRQNLDILEVNISSQPPLANRYNITKTPTVVLFQKGQEQQRLGDLPSPQAYETAIARYLNSNITKGNHLNG